MEPVRGGSAEQRRAGGPQKLRTQEQADYTALLKKYGVTVPTPAGPPAGLGQLQKLRNNAQFRADAQKLAGQFRTDMQAWISSTARTRAAPRPWPP